jgi:NitT/TauT family transport system ATP-binding protein
MIWREAERRGQQTMNAIRDATLVGSAAAPPILSVKDVTLQYRTRDSVVTATHRVSFDVYPAERFVLLGPSGCGKSTLLKAIAGFITPAEGVIRLNGAAFHGPGPDRMMVFQEFDQLLPWKTVLRNVAFPMLVTRRFPRQEIGERALAAIEKVGLTRFRDAYPHTLSGGMKQRVAIARATAMEPDVLLMDEPFAALDALTRSRMQDDLLRLWDDTRFTVLFVTHSIEEAIIVGSRILILSPHPGRVQAELNSGRFERKHQGARDFERLQQRIHSMLFSQPVEQQVVSSPLKVVSDG